MPICYVTSDLHLGNGQPDDPFEDFRQDSAFESWVADMDASTTLVLNGDVFECAQLHPLDVGSLPSSLAWDEEASLQKVRTAVAGHPRFFDALGGLLQRGGRLVFVIGNHDLDLAFRRVQAELRDRLASPVGADPEASPLRFVIGTYRYGGVHIAHGHEFSPENCPKDPNAFVHLYDDGNGERLFLERVWGTDFVLQIFNDIERRYPFADNVKPGRTVLWHGVKKGWVGGREAVRLVAFLARRRGKFDILKSFVLEGEADLPDAAVAPALLAASIDDEDWTRLIVELSTDDETGAQFSEEVAEGFASLDPHTRSILLDSTPIDDLGGAPIPGLPEAPQQVLEFKRRERNAAKDALKAGASHVVFGHTHSVVDGELGGKAFNPGTWIPRLAMEDPAVAERVRNDGFTVDVLSDPALFNYKIKAVRIRDDLVDLIPVDHDPTVPAVGRGV